MTQPVAETLRLSDFDYELPETLIAQEPLEQRDASRLLVLDRSTSRIEHRVFADIGSRLRPGDLLVLNDTKVIACRLPAAKAGGGRAEVFLLSEKGMNLWYALVKGPPARGGMLTVGQGIEAEIACENADGTRIVRFHGVRDIKDVLPLMGKTPLPPYIRREPVDRDRERYQTVYAEREGAVAAPTAGLHFTEGMLRNLREGGIEIVPVTLHVGPGTFRPVRTDVIAQHRMHPEPFDISPSSAESINRAKAEGRRVIAVGTTSVRAVETAADAAGRVRAGSGSSSLFLYPGSPFRVIDGMVTNFHLPKSTLLMLVSAFAGREAVLAAYHAAAAERYRFYSYGDAMLIL